MMKPEINRDIIRDRKILCEHYKSCNLALMQAAIIGSHWIDRASEAESELKVANHLIARLNDEKTMALIRAEKAENLLRRVYEYYKEGAEIDAPGHCHLRAGIWDDNGLPCEWCKTWTAVRQWAAKGE